MLILARLIARVLAGSRGQVSACAALPAQPRGPRAPTHAAETRPLPPVSRNSRGPVGKNWFPKRWAGTVRGSDPRRHLGPWLVEKKTCGHLASPGRRGCRQAVCRARGTARRVCSGDRWTRGVGSPGNPAALAEGGRLRPACIPRGLLRMTREELPGTSWLSLHTALSTT